jgi:hypothetical protein
MSHRLRAMVRALLSTVAVAAIALAATASGGATGTRDAGRVTAGPFLLVKLASLGTITWRCEGDRYGLGYRLPHASATTRLVFRVGTSRAPVQTAVLQRGGMRLPARREVSQRISLTQMTEPRTLKALIRVTFAPVQNFAYCASYLPPRVQVSLRAVFH